MENAVEAIKMIFGVIVFGVALTVFFQMTSLEKDTADAVFFATDKLNYTSYEANVEDRGKKVLKFDDIIPSIYRYAQEGYGITIIDNDNNNNKIVGRFDVNTENLVSEIVWSDQINPNKDIEKNNAKMHQLIAQFNLIINEANKTKDETGTNLSKFSDTDYNGLEELISKLYYGNNNEMRSGHIFCSWNVSNKLNSYIVQRVNCDIYGNSYTQSPTSETWFSSKHEGIEADPSDTSDAFGSHVSQVSKILGAGHNKGLFGEYQGQEFYEYILTIDESEKMSFINEDGDHIETNDLVYGNMRYGKKREIIYIKK